MKYLSVIITFAVWYCLWNLLDHGIQEINTKYKCNKTICYLCLLLISILIVEFFKVKLD